jgi:hypothetical protein
MHTKRWSLRLSFIPGLLVVVLTLQLTASGADELADLRAMDQRIEGRRRQG